jgi:hypothetical protein
VDDAVCVGGTERVGERNRNLKQPIERHATERNEIGERLAVDQLHRQVVHAVAFFD